MCGCQEAQSRDAEFRIASENDKVNDIDRERSFITVALGANKHDNPNRYTSPFLNAFELGMPTLQVVRTRRRRSLKLAPAPN